MPNKKTERSRLQSQLQALDSDYRQQAEREIHQKLIKFLSTQKPQPIALYLSKESEVNTDPIQDWLLNHQWKIFIPRVEGTKLKFYPLPKNKSELVWKEYFKIWEPPQTEAPESDFQIMIVPVVGYNKEGYRLGHGQGYYDRWLQQHRPKLTIGLAYNEQATSPQLIFNNFDVPLDWIITNKKEKND